MESDVQEIEWERHTVQTKGGRKPGEPSAPMQGEGEREGRAG